jgi:hypothetical protein
MMPLLDDDQSDDVVWCSDVLCSGIDDRCKSETHVRLKLMITKIISYQSYSMIPKVLFCCVQP